MSLKTGQALISPEGRRFKVHAVGGCDSHGRAVTTLHRIDRKPREQKVVCRPAAEVEAWADMESSELLFGVLSQEKVDAFNRGEQIEVTAEEAGAFRCQMDLRHEKERDTLRREVAAWRERFPTLYYRSMDDCIDWRVPHA